MQLFDDIRFWRKGSEQVCFVTFNYDRLVEISLTHANILMRSFPDYMSSDYLLIKLHGSVNWGRIVSTPIDLDRFSGRDSLARELIKRCPEINISRQYVMEIEQYPNTYENYAVFPALAIPVEEKVDFECPNEHIEKLRSFIPNVTKLLIIGWRATETPFLKLLEEGLPKGNRLQVMTVNGGWDDCVATDNRLNSFGIMENTVSIPKAFQTSSFQKSCENSSTAKGK